MHPCRGLLESRWVRTAGQMGVGVTCEYAVCRAKRREHAALMIDGMKEADSVVRIIPRVPVGKISM